MTEKYSSKAQRKATDLFLIRLNLYGRPPLQPISGLVTGSEEKFRVRARLFISENGKKRGCIKLNSIELNSANDTLVTGAPVSGSSRTPVSKDPASP